MVVVGKENGLQREEGVAKSTKDKLSGFSFKNTN